MSMNNDIRFALTTLCVVSVLAAVAGGSNFPVKVYSAEGGVEFAKGGTEAAISGVTLDWRGAKAQPVAVYDFGPETVGGYAVFTVKGFTPQGTNSEGRAVGFPVLRLSYCTHPRGLRPTGDFTRRKCIAYLGKCFDNPVLPANVNRFELYTIARNGTFVAPLVQGQERYLRVQLDTPGTSVTVDGFEIRNTGVFSREKPVGSFRCSDERVNRAWDMSVRTCEIASVPNNDAWRVVAGKLLPRKLERGSVAGFVQNRTWAGDGKFSATFEMAHNPHFSGALGLMLRAKDDRDGVIVVAEQPAVVKIFRRKNGVNTELVRKVIDEPIVDGVFHTLAAKVEGKQVEAIFDGVSIIAAEVGDMADDGRFGLYVEKEWWPAVNEVRLENTAGKTIFMDDFSAADDEGRLPGWDYTKSYRFMADGAKRDRLVWSGDLWWAERTCFYAFDKDWPYLRESLRLLAFNQTPEGYIWASPFAENHVKPQSGEYGHFPSDEFTSWLVPVLWDYYLFEGDEELVRELFPAVKRDLGWLRSRCDDEGLFVQRIETSSNSFCLPPNDPRQRLFTQVVIWKAFEDGVKLAKAIGRTDEATEWSAFANKMAAATRKHFYLAEERDFAADLTSMKPTSGARSILMPTRFATREEARSIAGKTPLCGSNKNHLNALRGMFEYGYDETAFAMIESGAWFALSDPSWGGAHCCTECGWLTCDGYYDESHPDTAVAGPIGTYLLGIEPIEPGYRRFRFAPHVVTRLSFAEGKVPTPHGFVEARWELKDGVVTARLTVPAGTEAVVEFPKVKFSKVYGSGTHEIVVKGLDAATLADRGTAIANKVIVEDQFWSPRFALWRTNTIYDVFSKLETKSRAMANFDSVAAGKKGCHHGHHFYDGLLYESIRGASDYLGRWPDAKLDQLLDGVIARIVAAQRADGYLHTGVQDGHENQQWGDNGGCALTQHEIYNAGCLIEAGVHHYRATGKTKLLDAGIRFANYLCDTIGPRPKRNLIPSHSVTENALVELVRLSKEAKLANVRADDYLKLIKFWFDAHGDNCGLPDWEKLVPVVKCRGVQDEMRRLTRTAHDAGWRLSLGDYQMDAKPLREYQSIEGHAVRAALLDLGLAAYARETGDSESLELAKRFWNSMTGRKLYISGGVGAKSDLERFAADFELPPNAYLETCAAVASAFTSEELARIEEDGKYMDEFERVIYNALLTAVGQNGCTYTYQNPLNTEKGARWDWHGCPCCPPMFLKLTGHLPECIYSTDERGIRVDLFIGSRMTFAHDGVPVKVAQHTRYPDAGKVEISVSPERPVKFRLAVRIPGWARGIENHAGLYRCEERREWTLVFNGKRVDAKPVNGYAVIEREWKPGDMVALEMDVSPRRIHADERVTAVRGMHAIACGPVLMAEERGKLIPYWQVANEGPAPHRVWVEDGK